MPKRKFTKPISPVIDIFPQLCLGRYTLNTIGDELDLLQGLGFKRVYVVATPPGYPMLTVPLLDVVNPLYAAGQYALQSILTVKDANFAYAYEAHKRGMEIFAIMKPYEGGGCYTIPHGKTMLLKERGVSCIGGERQGLDALLSEHPEFRVKSKPIPDYEAKISRTIATITLSFMLDQVEIDPGWFGPPSEAHLRYVDRMSAVKSDETLETHPLKERIKIWTSYDNGSYEPYEGEYVIEEQLRQERILDANRQPVYEGESRCRQVTISKLHIPSDVPYVAVTLDADEQHLVTIPFSMIQMWAENGEEIPSTSSGYVRNRATEADKQTEQIPERDQWFLQTFATVGELANLVNVIPGSDFRKDGFEFDKYGPGILSNAGWQSSRVYGLARGKFQYMKGTHCEAYPEVREYWLEHVNKLLAMGFDGIDIRLQNHSGQISNDMDFGYNEPIAEEYRRKHGVNIYTEQADPLELMRIRGDFFAQFVEQASQLIHDKGKKLQMHFHDFYQTEDSRAYSHWTTPKIIVDWKRLMDCSDEVTIKNAFRGSYNQMLADEIKQRAREQGKPVWVHAYIHQGNDITDEFFHAIEQDEAVAGVLLYEMQDYRSSTFRNIGLIQIGADGKVTSNTETLERLNSIIHS
ncbi:hypothetical protein [Paenibacillus koleovorans]|uniref:hypothetical protein n=1 Tax=Paenibacillus koleovorans TaxID=121608 RepID=UPI000FDC19A8|nr:hypothetical protein [Paenibacillus koleovorans]